MVIDRLIVVAAADFADDALEINLEDSYTEVLETILTRL